jgi:hypothetical protein
MTRLELIPQVTADGRHVVFKAVAPKGPERVRRAIRRALAALRGA